MRFKQKVGGKRGLIAWTAKITARIWTVAETNRKFGIPGLKVVAFCSHETE